MGGKCECPLSVGRDDFLLCNVTDIDCRNQMIPQTGKPKAAAPVHRQFVYSWGSRALDINREGNFFISTAGVNYNLCNANGYIRKFFLSVVGIRGEVRMIKTFAVL